MARRKSSYPMYNTVKLDRFDGGLSTRHPATLDTNQLVEAKNVVLTSDGRVKPRPGMRRRFAADFGSHPVKGMGVLYKSDRTSHLVIASGTSLYKDNPHVVFEFDERTEWEQGGVYTNLDTASEPGAIKLQSVPGISFVGTSPTYDKVWV